MQAYWSRQGGAGSAPFKELDFQNLYSSLELTTTSQRRGLEDFIKVEPDTRQALQSVTPYHKQFHIIYIGLPPLNRGSLKTGANTLKSNVKMLLET